jgi:hypothetical protein
MVKIPISDQDVIPPDLTKTPKVILAGFIRTGTVSMSIAMQILLKGPVCHSGSVRIFWTLLCVNLSVTISCIFEVLSLQLLCKESEVAI